MKKVFFYMSLIGLVGCGSYTVKNDFTEDVKVGDVTLKAGQCGEFNNDFFGLLGEYPLTITKVDGEALSESASADKEYEAVHWQVQADGQVVEAKTACEVVEEEEEEEAEEGDTAGADKTPDKATSATGTAGATTPAVAPGGTTTVAPGGTTTVAPGGTTTVAPGGTTQTGGPGN